jgi:hypothetical protein
MEDNLLPHQLLVYVASGMASDIFKADLRNTYNMRYARDKQR